MRRARIKISENEAWYHLISTAAGHKGDYPFNEHGATRRFINLVQHYASAYYCEVAAFCVMGTHTHIVARFEKPRCLTKKELNEKASLLYPNQPELYTRWNDHEWKRFEARLFDVSEFMRNIHMAFARWYNKTFARKGRFWADRFKSVLLEGMDAVLDCMLYVELNPVRAGLVERPELWKGSSYYLRDLRKDDWLKEITAITGISDIRSARKEYRARLYYRGEVPTKDHHRKIKWQVLLEEHERGFESRGLFRKRLRYFTDGVVVGTEERLRKWIERFRDEGLYLRRCNPIVQSDSVHVALREQRTNFVDMG